MSQDGLEEERTALPGYGIEIGTEPLDRPVRNSIGGGPYFDDGQEWPRCFCGERMALFFQLDVPEDVEFFGGEHLSVFHCAHHNEASDPVTADGRLVPRCACGSELAFVCHQLACPQRCDPAAFSPVNQN
ncbi:hypothetical protein [Streptomyces sp. F-7]|uniref:hypothetical protein n=1 Tax=Streptomyces sp. F-7 TaxID=573566 RepID=UPI000ABCC6BD|nr:hypothetical protein [Streptomyces sp. F-7]